MMSLLPLVAALLAGASAGHVATDNGLFTEVANHPLSTEGLASPEAQALLADPYFQEIYPYLAHCALPPGTTLEVPLPEGMLTLAGALGLAPEWADGPCEEACQEWMTACISALTNYYDVHVEVMLAGNWSEAAKVAPEDQMRAVQEGAFYGNMFLTPPRMYSCRGTGYDPLTMTFRRCARPGSPCGFQWVGACGATDGDTGQAAIRRACRPEADGVYGTCSNRATVDGEFPEPHREYARVVTVWLERTSFSPCPDGTSALDPSAAQRPDPSAGNTCLASDETTCVGAACANDDGCQSDKFACDVLGLDLGMCTTSCVDGSPEDEEAQCGGPGTTCLSTSEGGQGGCTRACDPEAADGEVGACGAGRACTGYWWYYPDGNRFGGDDAGCARFCQTDADCDPGNHCHPRTGRCEATPPNPAGRKDGEPCRTDMPNPCRGTCFWVVAPDDPRGICGSYVDVRASASCIDSAADASSSKPAFDALGYCLFRQCQTGLQCTPPLECRSDATGEAAYYRCTYP